MSRTPELELHITLVWASYVPLRCTGSSATLYLQTYRI